MARRTKRHSAKHVKSKGQSNQPAPNDAFPPQGTPIAPHEAPMGAPALPSGMGGSMGPSPDSGLDPSAMGY